LNDNTLLSIKWRSSRTDGMVWDKVLVARMGIDCKLDERKRSGEGSLR